MVCIMLESSAALSCWVSHFFTKLGRSTTVLFILYATFIFNISDGFATSISGILYADEGITPVSGIVTLAVATSSSEIYQTTATNGVYQIPNITLPIGVLVSVWVSGDPATRAFVITKTSSTADILGLDLYQNRVIVRHEASSGASITNADLALFDNHKDTNIQFAVERKSLIVFGGQELYVWPSKTFAPGGAVTISSYGSASAADGSFHLASNAVLIAKGAITLGGNWRADAGSKFRPNSNTVTFNATTTGRTISGVLNGSSTFYKLAFSGIGGAWTIANPIRVSAANAVDTFVIRNGSVTLGNGTSTSLEIDGKMVIAGVADDVASFATAPVPTGAQTIVDVNMNAAPPACPNCIISVGAIAGHGHGALEIAKNTLVRLNSSSASGAGIVVKATGRLAIEGEETATGAVLSLAESPMSSTITAAGTPWKNGQFNGLVARISNTSSLAFGQIYTILSSTESGIVVSATSTPTDPNPTVAGETCSGNGLCTLIPSLGALTAGHPTGRYLHNITDNKYYLIASASVENSAKFMIANGMPDDFTTMASGKSVEVTDGIRPGDSFQILSYAAVAAQSGLACGTPVNAATTAYIYAQAGSKNLIRYADICNLGRGVSHKFGLEFDGLNGAIDGQGTVAVEYSRIRNNLRGIFLANSKNMNGTLGIRYNLIQNATDGGIVGDATSNSDFSYNRIALSGRGGVWLFNQSNGNSLIGNISYQNALTGIAIEDSDGNRLNSNVVFRNQFGAGGLFLDDSSNSQVTNLTSFGNGMPSRAPAKEMVGFGILSSGGRNNLIASSTFFANVRSGIVVADSPGNGVINNRSFANGYHGMTQVCHARAYPVTLFDNKFYLNNLNGLMLENIDDCIAYVINDRYGTLGSNGAADLYLGAAGMSHPGAHRLYLFNTFLGSPTSVNLSEMADLIDQRYFIISRKHNGVAGSTQIWGHYVIKGALQNESAELYNHAYGVTAPIFTSAEPPIFDRWLKNHPTLLRWLEQFENFSGTGSQVASLHYTVNSGDLSEGPYYYRLTATTSTCPTNCQFAVWRNGTLVGTATVGQAYTDSNGFGFTVDNPANPYEAGDTYTFTVWDASNGSYLTKSVVMNP